MFWVHENVSQTTKVIYKSNFRGKTQNLLKRVPFRGISRQRMGAEKTDEKDEGNKREGNNLRLHSCYFL